MDRMTDMDQLSEFNAISVEEPVAAYGPVRSFRDLIVWQHAMDATELVYAFASKLPGDERFGLKSQMCRAAVSVPSNIAEGWGRGSSSDRQLLSYVRIARGSLFELETQLELAPRLYPQLGLDPAPIALRLTSVARMLSKMISKIEERHEQMRKEHGKSFLEMLDVLNDDLVRKGDDPIAFDHDCREGICGMCSLFINGEAHGPGRGITTCQLHMRKFKDGDTIYVEPWRSAAFPVIKDLATNRGAFDRIQAAGGFVSVNTSGNLVDGNAVPIPKDDADKAFDAATCIGCGACVASCPNGSAMLFTAAKVSQLSLLPQGRPEAKRRALAMVEQMDKEGFGNCSNVGACEIECPKGISLEHIARLNREYLVATVTKE